MDNTLTKSALKSDAEYEAEFEEIMAEIKQHETTFDQLQSEIVLLREEGARISARGDVLQEAINRQMKTLWGDK